jgi:threonine dehydrogenase-like Zn-dependent dehydrogenase
VVVEPRDVIIAVELAGICGSDLHVYRGKEVGLDVGTILGHELLGRVVDAGQQVAGLIGQRVVAAFSSSCGNCFFCNRDLTARCEFGRLLGWVEEGEGLHGAQAELVRVPLADTSVARVPETVGATEALFAGDILSTGIFAATSGGVRPGDAVAVIGCGPVGLMCAAAAQEAGAAVVWALDPIEARLELARRFGAVPLRLEASPVEVVGEATAGRGADVVLEAVGTPEASRLAYDLIRPGGVIAAAGVHTEPVLAFSPGEAYDKNLTYRAGRSSAFPFMPRAFEIARSGRYPLAAVVSHELPLAEGPRGYDMFDRKLDHCTKVLLRP